MSDDGDLEPTAAVADDDRAAAESGSVHRRALPRLPVGLALLVAGGLLTAWLVAGAGPAGEGDGSSPGDGTPAAAAPWSASLDADADGAPPPSLVAAERFVDDPGAESLRSLIRSIGGIDSAVIGEAEGAFDLVRFDPLDPDRLIASVRSSYGRARNEDSNELWLIDAGGLSRTTLAADTPHDFAHFNPDGTITMWVHADDSESFAPRVATVLDRDQGVVLRTEPLFASRFAIAADTVFALTGDGNYYSNNDGYEQLVAAGPTLQVLDNGRPYAWIDTPVPELLVAYPASREATTAVWSTSSQQRLLQHPLAGQSYRRLAVSGDQRTAVGITFDGTMEHVDLATGQTISEFGTIDPEGIDQPITLDQTGSTAVTVDRHGTVALWWVGDDDPVATIDADAAQPRWVSAPYAARTASTVAPAADRLALRTAGRAQQPTTWTIIDIGIDHWISRACEISGRALTAQERTKLGINSTSAACI